MIIVFVYSLNFLIVNHLLEVMYISNIKLTVNLQKETQMNAVEIKKTFIG